MTKLQFFLFSVLIFFSLSLYSQESNRQQEWSAILKSGKAISDSSCEKIDSIIAFAMTKKGCSYRRANAGPNSFDCSGFTSYVFKQFGINLLRSSRDQYTIGMPVNRDDIRKGDLVFFIRGKQIGHVALVIDTDTNHHFTFIHASTYKTGVRIDKSTQEWYRRTFAGARRIVACQGENDSLVRHESLEVQSDSTLLPRNIPDTVSVVAPPAPKPAPVSFYYKIRKGDTLSHIARKYHVSVAQLKKWNRLHSDFIREGQKLKIYRK